MAFLFSPTTTRTAGDTTCNNNVSSREDVNYWTLSRCKTLDLVSDFLLLLSPMKTVRERIK